MRTFTARPTPVRSSRLLAGLVVLLALLAGTAGATMTAEAAPPSHAKGGGGSSTSDSGDQKCHPKKGCPSEEPANTDPEPDPTTDPDPEPEPEPSPDPEPTSEPDPESTHSDEDLKVETVPLVDPTADRELQHMGQSDAAASGDAAVVLTTTRNQVRPRLTVRRGSNEMWHVPLPYDSTAGWANAVYTIDTQNRLHVLGAASTGMVHRRYQLTGTPPTSASLIDTMLYGNSDSRVGAVVALSSGSVVATWHQQGETTAQGHHLLHVTANGQRQVQELRFLPTRASKSALVQHPADGSVWLFANPDAWGRIGAARMVESGKGLTVDWADAYFFSPGTAAAPDPENPRVHAAADPTSGTVVVAYQSADRILVSGTRASRIAVTRVRPDASHSTTLSPSRTERITPFGLSVAAGAVHLTHPVVQADGSFTQLRLSRLDGTSWAEADLGRLPTTYDRVAGVTGRPESVARGSDGVPLLYDAG